TASRGARAHGPQYGSDDPAGQGKADTRRGGHHDPLPNGFVLLLRADAPLRAVTQPAAGCAARCRGAGRRPSG
ncbi:hypothetical protein ABT381_34980, partial [Streptomyces sp. NPDC000151]|uniref:hypothetical protein n=1 Tax=Streptomyces sp. NPDC000151 TaxID=3154244 RepID=UPI00331FC388